MKLNRLKNRFFLAFAFACLPSPLVCGVSLGFPPSPVGWLFFCPCCCRLPRPSSLLPAFLRLFSCSLGCRRFCSFLVAAVFFARGVARFVFGPCSCGSSSFPVVLPLPLVGFFFCLGFAPSLSLLPLGLLSLLGFFGRVVASFWFLPLGFLPPLAPCCRFPFWLLVLGFFPFVRFFSDLVSARLLFCFPRKRTLCVLFLKQRLWPLLRVGWRPTLGRLWPSLRRSRELASRRRLAYARQKQLRAQIPLPVSSESFSFAFRWLTGSEERRRKTRETKKKRKTSSEMSFGSDVS